MHFFVQVARKMFGWCCMSGNSCSSLKNDWGEGKGVGKEEEEEEEEEEEDEEEGNTVDS